MKGRPSLENKLESFAVFLVQDFLSKKGMTTTLQSFNEDCRAAGCTPSDASWYELSSAIDLPHLTHVAKARNPGQPPSCVLETVLSALGVERPGSAPDVPLPTGMSMTFDSSPYAAALHEPPSPAADAPASPLGLPLLAKDKRLLVNGRPRVPSDSSKGISVPSIGSTAAAAAPLPGSPSKAKQQAQLQPKKRGAVVGASSPKPVDVDSVAGLGWIPLPTRLRMLKREMEVLQVNASSHERLEKDRESRAPSLTAIEAAKQKEALLSRKPRIGGKRNNPLCAVCELPFALLNLPLVISYKAVLDLRASWGTEASEKELKDPRLHPPLCYDGVRTCRFCAQFFEDDSYKTLPVPERAHSPIKPAGVDPYRDSL